MNRVCVEDIADTDKDIPSYPPSNTDLLSFYPHNKLRCQDTCSNQPYHQPPATNQLVIFASMSKQNSDV